MAVQLAVPSAQEFLQLQSPAQSASQGAVSSSSDGQGESGSGFDGFLSTVQALRSLRSSSGGVTRQSTLASRQNRLDGVSQIFLPIGRGVIEDLDRLEDLNELGEEALAEQYGAEQAELIGEMGDAVIAVRDAAMKMSRFDPDLILGDGFKDSSLHKALRDFLEKLEGLNLSHSDGESIDTEEEPSVDDLLSNAAALIAPVLDVPAPVEGTGEGEAANTGSVIPDAVSADWVLPETTEDETEARDSAADFLETLNGAASDAAVQADDGTNSDSDAQTLDDLLRTFRDAIASRREESGKSQDSGSDAENSQKREAQIPRLKDISSSQSGSRALRASAAGDTKDAGIEAHRTNSFVSEVASAMSSVKEGEPAEKPQAPTATLPGTTYTLEGENAFGTGVTSVLEFMRSDGLDEARIVVEPPALGRIDVSLQATASGVEAIFKVDNEHLKQMLQQQLDTLKSSLQAQGINVSGLAVDIKERDDQKGRGDLYGTNKKSRRIGGVESADDSAEEPARMARLDLERGLLHWVA